MESFVDSEPSMPQLPSSASLLDHFSALSDPRQRWRVLYPLPEILLLVLCATLSGMENFVEIRLWGDERLAFLRRFLPYERGLPAHDRLNDVINGLDAALFKTCFATGSRRCATARPISSPSTARPRGEPTHAARAARAASRCIWFPPGPRVSASSSASRPSTPSPTRSSPFRCCCSGSNWPARWSPSTIGTQIEIADRIVARGGDYLLALQPGGPPSRRRRLF
jgi:DDE_Tnp_1-associated